MNHQENKNHPTLKRWLIIGCIAVGLICAMVMIMINRAAPKVEDWVPVIPGEAAMSNMGETLPNGEHAPSHEEHGLGGSDSTSSTGMGQAGAPGNTAPVPTLGHEDPYENWLASAMVIGISMQYPDSEILGIYTASQTPVSAHEGSAGAYVVFKSNGETMALKSTPLSKERGDKGTTDLHVPAIGYATYELVDPNSISHTGLTVLQIEDLEELIIASSQVSIIKH